MANIFVGVCPNLRKIFGKIPLLMGTRISDFSSVVLAPQTAWRPDWPSPFSGPDERFMCIHQTTRCHILGGLNKIVSVNILTHGHPTFRFRIVLPSSHRTAQNFLPNCVFDQIFFSAFAKLRKAN